VTSKQLLRFLAERLVYVYGENPNTDYIQAALVEAGIPFAERHRIVVDYWEKREKGRKAKPKSRRGR
jgi:hypothetical protein